MGFYLGSGSLYRVVDKVLQVYDCFGCERYHASPVKDWMIMGTVCVCGGGNSPCVAVRLSARHHAPLQQSLPRCCTSDDGWDHHEPDYVGQRRSGPGQWTEKIQLAFPFPLAEYRKRRTSSLCCSRGSVWDLHMVWSGDPVHSWGGHWAPEIVKTNT